MPAPALRPMPLVARRWATTQSMTPQENIALLNAQRLHRPNSPHFTIYQPQVSVRLRGRCSYAVRARGCHRKGSTSLGGESPKGASRTAVREETDDDISGSGDQEEAEICALSGRGGPSRVARPVVPAHMPTDPLRSCNRLISSAVLTPDHMAPVHREPSHRRRSLRHALRRIAGVPPPPRLPRHRLRAPHRLCRVHAYLGQGLGQVHLCRAVHFPLVQRHQAFGLGHRIRCVCPHGRPGRRS